MERLHCKLFIKRKNRYCNLTPSPGEEYCQTHKNVVDGNSEAKLDKKERNRVPCPLDPRHTVFEDQLDIHIKKKCPSIQAEKQLSSQPFYLKNINNCSTQNDLLPIQPKSNKQLGSGLLKSLSKEELSVFLEKINQTYNKFIPSIPNQIKEFDNNTINHNKPNHTSHFKSKHDKQEFCILGQLNQLNVLDNPHIFFEWGAGKGHLTHLIKQNSIGKRYYLVDKQKCFKNKADRFEPDKESYIRIGIDIKDFNLQGIQDLHENSYVSFSKHLCGQATDLTLRCVTKTSPKLCEAIVIALCCHHKCNWSNYIYQEYFTDTLQFTSEEFQYLMSISSWAIDTNNRNDNKEEENEERPSKKQKEENNIDSNTNDTTAAIINKNNELSVQERQEYGFKAKRLIDIGRIAYLEKNGYQASLIYFVENSVTPENCMLIAVPKKENKS